jgi:arginase family enzyme
VWEDGLTEEPRWDPARVVMCGVRDVDPGERVLLTTHGVGLVERPSELAPLLEGRDVFVHLDLDVLDPAAMPGLHWPVAGGMSDGGLRTLLAEVGGVANVIGVEITNLPQAALARRVATIAEPLMPIPENS